MGTDETQPDVQPVTPAPDPTSSPSEGVNVPPVTTGTSADVQPAVTLAPAPESQEAPLVEKVTGAPAPAPPAESAAPASAAPVRVDSKSARDDNDALEGQFCQVVSGPYQGRRGLFESVGSYDPETGYPSLITVRTRDAQNELLSVEYADVRPAVDYSGGR